MKKTHIRIEYSGNRQKWEFFNFLLQDLDKDWPFAKTKKEACEVCGGCVWKNPRFGSDKIKIISINYKTHTICGQSNITCARHKSPSRKSK